MDAKKYHNKFMALEEAAKNEIIGLLKNNPKGRFIQPNDHYGEDDFHFTEGVWALTGDEDAIIVTAVGLFDDDKLMVRAGMMYSDYNNNEWFAFDEHTHCYWELYEFVVDHLDDADTEPVIVKDASEDDDDDNDYDDDEENDDENNNDEENDDDDDDHDVVSIDEIFEGEAIKLMTSHGMDELLLQQQDDCPGGWAVFDDMDSEDIEDCGLPLSSGEMYNQEEFRLVRLGIIDGKLKFRKQTLILHDDEYFPDKEAPQWYDIDYFDELKYTELLYYLDYYEEIWEYTKNHPELLVLK